MAMLTMNHFCGVVNDVYGFWLRVVLVLVRASGESFGVSFSASFSTSGLVSGCASLAVCMFSVLESVSSDPDTDPRLLLLESSRIGVVSFSGIVVILHRSVDYDYISLNPPEIYRVHIPDLLYSSKERMADCTW